MFLYKYNSLLVRMTQFDEDSKIKISNFNEAMFQMLRLHDYWTKTNQCAINGDYLNWNLYLNIIWRELSADAKEINEKYYFNSMKIINDSIKKTSNKTLLNSYLEYKQIFLKNLQEKCGKGSSKRVEHKRMM